MTEKESMTAADYMTHFIDGIELGPVHVIAMTTEDKARQLDRDIIVENHAGTLPAITLSRFDFVSDHEEEIASRMRRATQRQELILSINGNSREAAEQAHYLRGEPHPDDAYLPLNLWDEE